MRTLSHTWAAALLLAASGCESPRAIPSGLSAELQQQVEFCESMDDDVEDWCVFQAVHDSFNVPGEPFYLLCRTMTVPDAHDACMETLARTAESSNYPNLCAEILSSRLRESCYLMRAEESMRSAPSIFDVISACQKTGSLSHHCLGHVPAQRKSIWQNQGGVMALYRDAIAIVTNAPEAASSTGVGFGFGTAIREMAGPQGASACQAFQINTDARSACIQASTADVGGNASGGGPGGMVPGGIAPP